MIRAIAAINRVDPAPFRLIFAGGTALARAHRIVGRMSEDVDFKIVPTDDAPTSRNALHRALGGMRDQVSAALRQAGFVWDLAGRDNPRSRSGNRYSIWQLPYDSMGDATADLRATIQIELTFATLRLPSVAMPVSSFVAQAHRRAAEVTSIDCVALAETAAEKLVSLTRRTAMEIAGLSHHPDLTLVRHIYDLHALRPLVDPALVIALADDIAQSDAAEFRNQFPAYAADIGGQTRIAVTALQTDRRHRRRYDDFVTAMVYGERPGFDDAIAAVATLAEHMQGFQL